MSNIGKSHIPDLVSVIIPTFNRSNLVVKAIDSVLAQTYPNVEIIVIDDCSTDNTISVLEKYGNKIQFHRNDVNSYVGFTRNFGVSIAKGEYIAFLDSDDCWLPDKLEVQISWMKINKFDISVTSFYTYHKNTNSLTRKDRPYSSKLRFIDILYGIYIAPGSTLVMKRDFFVSIGGYNVSYRRLEDWDLLIRIFLKNEQIGFLKNPTAQIFASNDYTVSNLKESSKKLFRENSKSLWHAKWYYPIILIVGLLFELFVANFRSKRYIKAAGYFIMLNFLCLFQHPYFSIHTFAIKKLFMKKLSNMVNVEC